MPKKLITSKIKKDYKKKVQQLVSDLSQDLVVVQESPLFVDCPNCVFDSINKKSSNVMDSTFVTPVIIFPGTSEERTVSPVTFNEGRCPVCIGEGQLFTNKELCIRAMINFFSETGRRGQFLSLPAGKEGLSLVIIKTLACNYEVLLNNEVFFIHNNVKLSKFKPPFLRGLGGDDAICEVLMQTVDEGQRTSGRQGGDKLSREDDPRKRIKSQSDILDQRGRLTGR
jgi:hypothetical protein